MNENRQLAWLKLAFTYGVGPATALKLVNHFGDVTHIFEQSLTSLIKLISRPVAESILSDKSQVAVDKALAWKSDSAHARYLITLDDNYYPAELAEIASPPLVLFAQGKIELLKNQKIAVVGSRHPTNSGIENAGIFAKDLAKNGFTIVSGMASGIDRFAHEAALTEAASTIAVLGTGMDIIYPSTNRSLHRQILDHGLVISEFNLGVSAVASNFPRRNRIVVGLSKACLVVESTVDGGSMISANFALEMNRELMAIPGSIHNPMARGCHKLIKQGAKIIETTQDILEELKIILNNIILS